MSGWDRPLALIVLAAGVVLLFTAAGLYAVDRTMTPAISYSLIAGIALLLMGIVIEPRAVAELVRSRRARFGSLSVVVSAGLIGALVMANVIASRSLVSADLTRARYYTLSSQSVAVLKRLDSELTVTGFYRPSAAETAARHNEETLLAQYRAQNGHVTVRMVDPDFNYELARRLGVTISGSLAIQYRSKKPFVLAPGSQSEQDLTSAILMLESDRTPQVCWSIGQGEHGLRDTDEADGYSAALSQLQVRNYRAADLALATVPAVPADCDVLAIVGPTRPLSPGVAQIVADYLNKGGKAFLAADPYQAQANPSLNQLLKPYGVAYDGGLVIEPDDRHRAQNDLTAPVVLEFGSSPLARGMSGNLAFFSRATAIVGTPDPSLNVARVAATTSSSYEIMQPRDSDKDRGRYDRRPGDKPGPFTLLETLEKKQEGGKQTRIVVAGSSRLASNLVLPPLQMAAGNQQLFMNSIDWLSEQEDLISIPPKPARSVPLLLTDAERTVNILVTMVFLPLGVTAVGLLVWVRRRSPGPRPT